MKFKPGCYVLAVLLALMLVGGCASFNQFLCSPTDSQSQAADVGLAVAQSILTAAAMYSGGGEVITAIAGQAVPIFRQVVQGYCVTQAQWDAAVKALEDNQTQAKAIGAKFNLEPLKAIKWGK